MTGRARRWFVLGAVVVAVAAPVVLGVLLATPAGHAWSTSLSDVVDALGRGRQRLLRGGLRWIATPFVVLVVAWCFVAMIRAGRRRATLVAFVVGLGSFLTSEAIKLDVLPFPSYGVGGGRDVSGHVAMVAAALVVVAVAAPAQRRTRVRWVAWALLVGTSLGVIGARWHDAGDVVIPLSVATAWCVVAWAVLTWRRPQVPDGDRTGRSSPVGWVVVALCAAAAGLLVASGATGAGTAPAPTVLATVLAAVSGSTALALAGAALGGAADPQPERSENRTRSMTAGGAVM